jgi:hypothetical protein
VETVGKMIIGAIWAVGLVSGYIAVGFPTSKADIISPGKDYVAATIMYGKKNLPVENWEPAFNPGQPVQADQLRPAVRIRGIAVAFDDLCDLNSGTRLRPPEYTPARSAAGAATASRCERSLTTAATSANNPTMASTATQ